MSKTLRFGSALTAIAAASMVGGCATSREGPQSASIFGEKIDKANIGLATRAMLALEAKDYATAISLGERAVANSPTDAGFRALLGNAYFASGRFASAEAAFRDSLTLIPSQPQVVLKLALVQIAQGRNGEAVAFLNSARDVLATSDLGLALALAGQPEEAVAVLDPAARAIGADAQLRQNLALAHALAGNWNAARLVAAQDLSADLVDARIQQWMSFAKPVRASDQVAALTGVTPAASDPGQPVRLALVSTPTRMVEAAPAAVIAPEPEPQVVAEAAPRVSIESAPAIHDVAPAFAEAPVQIAPSAPPATAAAAPAVPQPQVEDVPDFVAASAPEAVFVAPRAARPVVRAAAPRKAAPVRNASLPRATGNSSAVVQLGAYGSRERVGLAWDLITKRYPALRSYLPMTARFNSERGTVYRLSIKGFASQQEAVARCKLLRSRGGSCFVRNVAGDAPIQYASR